MIALCDAEPGQSRVEELLQESVSPSRLGCWQQCRLKFFFKYVQELPTPNLPALHLGRTVHAVLQECNLARWHGHTLSVSHVKRMCEVLFDVEAEDTVRWISPKQKQTAQEQVKALVALYREESLIPEREKPLGVEVQVEADLARHGLPSLKGIIDLVRPGGIIVDYKTSAQTPVSAFVLHQHETQLTTYGVLYRDATGERESGLELHHLVKLKRPKIVVTKTPPVTEDQVTRLFRSLESYVEGVRREDFIPSPGLHCRHCAFFTHCRKWKGGE